jgi:predicted NBD/HSP70 family sugar kinase
MAHAVGVLAMEHIAAGLVEGDRIVGPIRTYPDQADEGSSVLPTLPPAEIVQAIARLIDDVAHGYPLDVVGVGFPGVIREGIIEDSPNLRQMKGSALAQTLSEALNGRAHVLVLNDADAIATGIAATRGQLDTLTRVWTLGSGVGFGRYPHAPGIWEGGHVVVSLDPKESLCGCGGQGHLEGIVGHRSMRLRFLDMEPEEVFAQAAGGDARCAAFVRLWHRAMAAAAAGSIHMDGPGRFFLSGPNARFVDTAVLAGALHDMVKMSPLQGSAFEVVAGSDDLAIIGAAVGARQSAA